MSQAGAAKLCIDLLDDHLLKEQSRLDKQVFMKLTQGHVVTPEEALQFVHAKYAHWRLLQSLEQKLQAGRAATARALPYNYEQEVDDATRS